MIVLAALLLAACAGVETTESEPAAAPASTDQASEPVRRSADDIDPDLLFHALAAERLAAEGNDFEAFEHAYQAALLSENPETARQAVSLAMRVGDWAGVVAAAERWQALAPELEAAEQLIVLGLINQGQVDAASGRLARKIGQADDRSEAWREATLMVAAAEQDANALAAFDALAEQAPVDDSGQVMESRSLLLWQLGNAAEAYALASEAADSAPTRRRQVWAAQLAAANEDYPAALDWYRQARATAPEDRELAMAEAEVLRQMDRMDEAIAALRSVPADTRTLYSLGLYLYQAERLEEAGAAWRELAAVESPAEPMQHAFFTGFLAELLEFDDDAEQWYARVVEGPDANRALLRRATLAGRSGDLMSARNLLRAVRLAGDAELAEESWLLEAELLRDAGRPDECVDVLSEVLREQPSGVWLLYSRALCAVDADNLDLAEQDLRRIIQMDGENAAALNALGYTLTDRTRRHSEALSLIDRAYELDPDDPAILDSMGWVRFRLGRPAEALVYLERAHEIDQNPEIGAHLAEVLWTLDRRDEARSMLDELIEAHPEHAVVVDTWQRLIGSEP
ncbi:tetratricopeptide (TPR) repeat protein [Wenzhouxiangella marina]|nr:tetratricopeptide (TPR) repeat protein [Wenzhouxiangella marina]